MTATATNALVSLAVLATLLFVVYGPWQWACTDYARQKLFEARDDIFDMAADGHLSFKSESYRTIRRSLEMNIRFAHDLTLPNFLFLLFTRKSKRKQKSDLHHAIENLPPQIRSKVEKRVLSAMMSLVLMMFFKSPVAMIVALPGVAAFFLIDSCKEHASRVVEFCSDLIQVEAENVPSAVRIPLAHHGTP